MKKVIWKYELGVYQGIQSLLIPIGAQLLTVQGKDGKICIWLVVDPTAETESKNFEVIGTGWEFFPEESNYMGTAQIGHFVWHVFERKI